MTPNIWRVVVLVTGLLMLLTGLLVLVLGQLQDNRAPQPPPRAPMVVQADVT